MYMAYIFALVPLHKLENAIELYQNADYLENKCVHMTTIKDICCKNKCLLKCCLFTLNVVAIMAGHRSEMHIHLHMLPLRDTPWLLHGLERGATKRLLW